ncbi:MAG: hypothetical protein BWX90_00062 [bacterium ADurb.Bin132]|nr:MAG: hypothetical protein BWX90_00062 [bacterium ADurb.Bin132]
MAEGVLLSWFEHLADGVFGKIRGLKQRFMMVEGIFEWVWGGITFITGCLVMWSGANVYNNPVLAHFYEFAFTFCLQVLIMHGVVRVVAGDDIEGSIAYPVFITMGIYSIIVLVSRILIVGGFTTLYFIGPEFTQYSGFVPDATRIWLALSIPLSLVVQFFTLKLTTKASWGYIVSAYFIYLVASIMVLLFANILIYLALYNIVLG